MKNLKIAAKLLCGFGTVLVMLLISAVVAFFNMNTIQSQVQSYSDYTVPNNNQVWQMRRDMISVQRYLLMALTESDDQLIASYLDLVETEAARIRTTLESYLTTTRADQSLLDSFQTNINTMGTYRTQIADLLIQNNDKANAEAYQIFVDSYKPILDKNADILQQIGEFQNARADQQATDSDNAFSLAIILLISVIAVAIVITIVMTLVITKAILSPVKEVQAVSRAITEGNLSATIRYTGKDELGALADNMRETSATLSAIIGDVDRTLGAMGDGDFTQSSQCPERYVGQFKNILLATRSINANLNDTLSRISEASSQVSAGSDQVSSGAQALAQGATEQASSVEELAATINEISQQVNETAENAKGAQDLAAQAGAEVTLCNEKMHQMNGAMEGINSSSSEISKVIKVIEDIAFQTNILALNAAVEAARAGTAGKGFAVVADEVRNLATKSQEAAKTTTALIESSIQSVEGGTALAKDTAVSLNKVVEMAQGVTQIIDKITNATNIQANSITQVTVGVDQISAVVQTNSATSEESAAASEELSGQAQMLNSLVSQFKLLKANHSAPSLTGYDDSFSIPDSLASTDFSSSKY